MSLDIARLVRDGLARRPRSLPPILFYDDRGTELFERICGLPEYYLTRVESGLIGRIAHEIPPAPHLVELGCGTTHKAAPLIDAFLRRFPRVGYVPVDISRAALDRAKELRRPGLDVRPIQATFEDAPLPEGSTVLMLGSNIGNFEPDDAARFLGRFRGHAMLVGFDLRKDPAVLHAAYNDSEGVTALFNLNALAHINRALGGDFDPAGFEHRAFFNDARSRIEMHLVSVRDQRVAIGADRHEFKAGDDIHTENSYKFTPEGIRELASRAGFGSSRLFTDDRGWFALALLA